ncbi:MAG: CAP domain-containing protein [Anaerolineales bacterium]
MKSKSFVILLIGTILLASLISVQGIHAQGDTTTTVINAINQRRVAQGLATLLVNRDLMDVAQQHSQLMASLGSVTEFGENGSTADERATAAGFGSGAEIQVFQNVACGINLTITEILEDIWNEGSAQQNLLNPDSVYIGVGVAYAEDLVCYTVVSGFWVGEADPTQILPSPTAGTPISSSMPSAVPIVVSTPGPDGTVKHTVEGGQALWIIASVYNIPLEELRELNQLEPDAVVNPGDVVIIKPSYTPTNTPIGQPSPTLPLRYTHTPSPAGYQTTQPIDSTENASTTDPVISEPRFRTSAKNPSIVIAAILISGITLAAAVLISIRNQR